jgi:flagella basal body P-ring formation protein FlgA
MHTARQALAAGWATALVVLSLLLLAGEPAQAADLELPVPRVTLYPGDTIGEARESVIGKVARRTLLPGQPIPLNGVRDPYLVMQGKTALVVFEEGGLTITANAMALQNGGVGDLVTLRNVDSGTVIKGTVAPDGTVRLAGP